MDIEPDTVRLVGHINAVSSSVGVRVRAKMVIGNKVVPLGLRSVTAESPLLHRIRMGDGAKGRRKGVVQLQAPTQSTSGMAETPK